MMKNIFKVNLLALSLLLGCLNLSSQTLSSSAVPAVVLRTINTQYPTVKDIKWEKTPENFYKASFVDHGKEITMVLDEGGSVVNGDKTGNENTNGNSTTTGSTTAFRYDDIPLNTRKQIEKKCNPADIISVCKMKGKGEEIIYEIELAKEKILFDENGNIVNEFSK